MMRPSGKDLVLADLVKDTHRTRRSVGVNVPPQFMPLILRAARAREMSVAAFIRRAIMAVVCYDLGLDWRTLMVDEPGTRRFEQSTQPAVREEGFGHGRWRIDHMGEHTRD